MRLRSLLIALALLGGPCVYGGSRAEPESWIFWRAAPIPFPEEITPQIPELLQGSSPIDFGPKGSDLTILLPDDLAANRDDRAVTRIAQLIAEKAPGARIMNVSAAQPADFQHHVLLLGTMADHPWLAKLASIDADFMRDIAPGGYRLESVRNPLAEHRSVILALGADRRGAWAAGLVLAHAIHPDKPGVNVLHNWPVTLPSGCYWLPFSARSSPPAQPYEVTGPPRAPPPPPDILMAVRVWGSPMPTLASYQRLIRALKPTGINAVVVQSGGWVDLPDAPEIFRHAVDIAWQEGIYTILYAGNEEAAHLPAPLTENHRQVVLATEDHPGLLGYHLYNQLAAKLTPAQSTDLESQLKWMRSVTSKPVGMEIVWGHRVAEIPADKQQLMRNLKAWGLGPIATDYAPIGGWTDEPSLPLWEKKLLELRAFEPRPVAVLQAHVPFLEATVPSREQLRNQFWWALAGGAHGFMIETAFLPTHYSMRGLLSWDLRPLPDGRFEAVREIAQAASRLGEFVNGARLLDAGAAAATGLRLEKFPPTLALRVRDRPDGTLYALIINADLARSATTRLTLEGSKTFAAVNVLGQNRLGALDQATPLAVTLPPGGGACIKLVPQALP